MVVVVVVVIASGWVMVVVVAVVVGVLLEVVVFMSGRGESRGGDGRFWSPKPPPAEGSRPQLLLVPIYCLKGSSLL